MKKVLIFIIWNLSVLICFSQNVTSPKNGEYKSYYENGKLLEIKHYKDDKLDGEYKSYYQNGQLEGTRYYKEDKLNGELKGYYENGQLWFINYYKDDKQFGEDKSYYQNGQLEDIHNYKDGKLDGERKRYYENGLLKDIRYFKDGKLDGEEKDYNENSTLVEIKHYKDGNMDGERREYQENGGLTKISHYKDDKQDGEEMVYYEDGHSMAYRAYYKDDKRNGEYKSYYQNGQLEGTGNYKDNKQDGEWKWNYDNGQLSGVDYWKDGKIIPIDKISIAKLDNNITGFNPSNKTIYSTILINGKEWMNQNLDLTTFRNGDNIPQAKTEQDLIDANKNQTPIWCYFDFNPATETNYGKLYNWYALNDPRGLMPIGFITPSVQDWQSLNDFSYFKNTNGRAELNYSETKEIHHGNNFFLSFENGPYKEKKYDRFSGVPEDEIGFYWTTGTFQDRYNDRINVYSIYSNGNVEIDKYECKGSCVSVRGIKGDHNYYTGNWIGNIKSGNGTEFYGINTEIKGYGIVHKGDKYSGNWVAGDQDGDGSIILNNGEIKSGLWKRGEFKGVWKFIDNRHKCFQCNINTSKSVKFTVTEIENLKKNAYSNEIYIYNTQSYCSSNCEAKAIAIQKVREKQYERENQSNLSKQQTSNTTRSNQGPSWHPCSYCNRMFDKPYLHNCIATNRRETKPGYVLCSACYGLGYITTSLSCDCDGWCYKEKCYVTGCEGGWYRCRNCNENAQVFW